MRQSWRVKVTQKTKINMYDINLHPVHVLCIDVRPHPFSHRSITPESHLESAERVLLGEVHRWDVVVKVALACAPESLQLVPFGQDGVALVV